MLTMYQFAQTFATPTQNARPLKSGISDNVGGVKLF